MWLLNTATLTLEQHTDPIPSYAILSHTWTNEEITFQDLRQPGCDVAAEPFLGAVSDEILRDGAGSVPREAGGAQANGLRVKDDFRLSPGYKKVLNTCRLSREQGIDYAWVDTCCIDKTSSAELSEAINSMYSWYEQSTVCYAYLEDFNGELPDGDETFIRQSKFGQCRWFSRGWTLQELIAPRRLMFYDSMWKPVADKRNISGTLRVITGIDADILTHSSNLYTVSVRTKMTWAAGRRTTRTEDIAYCLFGIFDVNMPLIYGEGHKAFQRLQQEIAIKFSGDVTLFAWSPRAALPPQNHRPPEYLNLRAEDTPLYRGAFAWAPEEFMVEGGAYAPAFENESVASPGRIELDARSGVVLRNMSIRWEGLLSPPRYFLDFPLGHGKFLCRAIEKTPQGYVFKSIIIPKQLKGWKFAASGVRLVSQADAVSLEARLAPNVYLRVDMKVALVAPTLVWPAERWDRVPQWFVYTLPELTNMYRPTILGVALVKPIVNVEVAPELWETRRLNILSVICAIPPKSIDSLEDEDRAKLGPPKILGIILVKESSNRFARIVHSFLEDESTDSLHDAVLYMQRNLRSSAETWEDWVEGFDKRGQELDLRNENGIRVGMSPNLRVRTFSAEKPVEYSQGNFWWIQDIWHDTRDKRGDWVPTSWVNPFNQWDPEEERFRRIISRQTIVPLGDEIVVPQLISQPSWQPNGNKVRRKSTRTLVERTSRVSMPILEKLQR